MTLDEVGEFYQRAIFARIHYMNDIRMGVWAEAKEIEKYYKKIVGGG